MYWQDRKIEEIYMGRLLSWCSASIFSTVDDYEIRKPEITDELASSVFCITFSDTVYSLKNKPESHVNMVCGLDARPKLRGTA